jgi:hypothetical protein
MRGRTGGLERRPQFARQLSLCHNLARLKFRMVNRVFLLALAIIAEVTQRAAIWIWPELNRYYKTLGKYC